MSWVAVGPPGQAGPIDSAGIGLLCLEEDLTSDRIGPFIREHFGSLRKAAIYDDPRPFARRGAARRGIALVSRLLADDALRTGRLQHLSAYPGLPLGTLWISRTEGPSRLPAGAGGVRQPAGFFPGRCPKHELNRSNTSKNINCVDE
jgi:LysR family glycine cleavage system transcriptional activator